MDERAFASHMPYVQQVAETLNSENNERTYRGTVVLAAAALDETLGRTIALFLVAGDKSETLLDPDRSGVLSAFGARIGVALALGLISAEVAESCRTVAKIRNRYAHDLAASLAEPKLNGLLTKIEEAVDLHKNWGKLTYEQRFSTICFRLIMAITARWPEIEPDKRKPAPAGIPAGVFFRTAGAGD